MTLRLACMAAFAVTLFAQGPGGIPGGTPPQPRVDAVKAYLGLSDTQVQGLQQILEQTVSSTRSLHEEAAQKERALAEQLKAGSTDAAALGRLLVDIQLLRKRIGELQTSAQAQAANILTAEQKVKLKALEDAVKLQPAIQQAAMLRLLTPPERPAGVGPGGPGGPGPGRFGGPDGGGPMMGGPGSSFGPMLGGPMLGGRGPMGRPGSR